MKSRIWFCTLLFVSIISLFLLVTGSSLLTLALDRSDRIPLGTFITWAGMISLPLTLYWSIQELRKPSTTLNKILAGSLKVFILLGILWVPISYLLAGNLSFSFSDKETFIGGQTAMKWFWCLSYGIGSGTLIIGIIYLLAIILRNSNQRNIA